MKSLLDNHELRFEGYPPIDKKTKYPICLEGAHACPPEDVGGFMGYAEYSDALTDPIHEQQLECRSRFDREELVRLRSRER